MRKRFMRKLLLLLLVSFLISCGGSEGKPSPSTAKWGTARWNEGKWE
jgi:hypothetical protein